MSFFENIRIRVDFKKGGNMASMSAHPGPTLHNSLSDLYSVKMVLSFHAASTNY